jgi:RNA polymerase primary sigma factor
MKSPTLGRRPSPTFNPTEEYPAREEQREFRPQTIIPVTETSEELASTQRPDRAQRLRPGKPRLRLLPDPARARSRDTAGAAIRLYLREIGQVKPLCPEEEIQLVARIRQGDAKARECLIKGNLRRVAEICREYENIGLPLLDLISEGNLGLLKAVQRFDPTNGGCFAEFSTWWIKQSIKRALARSS